MDTCTCKAESLCCPPESISVVNWLFAVVVQSLSHVQLFVISWTVACQAPLSMGFPRQEYWSGMPCSPPGSLPDTGIEPTSPALAAVLYR